MHFVQQNNVTDPEKAQELATAIFEFFRIELTLNSYGESAGFNEEEEINFDTLTEQRREADINLKDKFKCATGNNLYRLGYEHYVDGVKVF